MIMRSFFVGILGVGALLGLYFSVTSLVATWSFAALQFQEFWPYLIALAAGFGVQIGLYSYLRQLHQAHRAGHATAVSGTVSAVAMISCCSHYLLNVLPVIGATGVLAIVAQYQIEIFWIGLLSNVAGIIYITLKAREARHMTI